jgi:hypothetical protein
LVEKLIRNTFTLFPCCLYENSSCLLAIRWQNDIPTNDRNSVDDNFGLWINPEKWIWAHSIALKILYRMVHNTYYTFFCL